MKHGRIRLILIYGILSIIRDWVHLTEKKQKNISMI